MARLQILQLPEGADDERPPFALVIDQYQPMRYVMAPGMGEEPVDEFDGLAEEIGARSVLVFREPVEIPANAQPAVAVDYPEQQPDAEIIHAHEQTRLALCDALLLSRDTTWHQIIEQAAARQREIATRAQRLHEREGRPDQYKTALTDALGMDRLRDWDDILNAAAGLRRSRRQLETERDEARTWARHGYEIGQKHCGWSDHGVAPAWLTDGWPPHIEACEHLKQMAEFDEALARVRSLPEQPAAVNASKPYMEDYLQGYGAGVRAAKCVVQGELAQAAEGGV
ncbi:hypothetical protein [Streptomyces sp. NPDC001635]